MPTFRALALVGLATLLLGGTPLSANALDNLRTTDDIGINKVPHLGTSRVLVMVMRVGQPYTDGEIAQLESEFDEEGGPGSFREYWKSQSRGLYDPVPYLAPPIVYPECPIPELGGACQISVDDFLSILGGSVRNLLQELFERVRDENQLDLSQFDINSAGCPQDQECPDGYFDAVMLRTSMFSGIAFPLAALNNALTIETTPRTWPPTPFDAGTLADGGARDAGSSTPGLDAGPQGPTLTCGIIALTPPRDHEFGHALGLIDQYAGPTLNGVMSSAYSTGLSAYNRVVLDWGFVEPVTGPGTLTLEPVLETGRVLRFGEPPKFVMIENRGGSLHEFTDSSYPGLYMHSVDEDQLPTTPIGFLKVLEGKLYYPNEDPPYFNVTLPLECNLGTPETPNTCVMAQPGVIRDVEHSLDGHLGYHVAVTEVAANGSITFEVREGTRENPIEPDPTPDDDGGDPEPAPQPDPTPDPTPEPDDTGDDCGCTGTYGASWPVAALGILLLWRRRRRAVALRNA